MVNRDSLTKEQLAELAFTPEELAELKRAREMPITLDEDCPETTPERASKFHRVNPPRDDPRRTMLDSLDLFTPDFLAGGVEDLPVQERPAP